MREKSVTAKGNEKFKLIMGIALMVFAVAISAGTYAYYQSTITGSINGSIVEWECKVGGSSSSFNLNMGNLKPGASGKLDLALSVKNFKAIYTISLSNPSNIVDKMKFYTSSATQTSTTCLSKTGSAVSGCNLANTTTTLDATASGTASKTFSIYWNWPGAGADTPLSTSSNLAASIKVNVSCKQDNVTPYGA